MDFTEFLKLEAKVTLEMTSSYASFLNGKVECHIHTLANMVHAMLKNSGHNKNKWCFAAETAANIYCSILHSANDTSPFYAWYKIHPSIYDY